jgi:hypothetical protein
VQQIREEAIKHNGEFEDRISAMEAKIAAMPLAFDPSALAADIQALTAVVNTIAAAVCTGNNDDGAQCSVAQLPSCSPTDAEAGAKAAAMTVAWAGVRCSGFDNFLLSRMPLGFTPLLRLKLEHACDQCHSSRIVGLFLLLINAKLPCTFR